MGAISSSSNDDACTCLTVEGDWVFYSNNDDHNKIYRVKTDGSVREKISDDTVNESQVSNGWIYYRNDGELYRIYRMKVDGSERQPVNEERSHYICVGEE